MKKREKMTLKKETVSFLTGVEMNQEKGGGSLLLFDCGAGNDTSMYYMLKTLFSGKTCPDQTCATATCFSLCQTYEEACNTGVYLPGTCEC